MNIHTDRIIFRLSTNKQGFYGLVPCSSKVEKFERIIAKKKEKHKPVDAIKIITLFDDKTVLLFQDMFPVAEKYISNEYIKGGHSVRISDPDTVSMLEKTASKIVRMIRKGVRFTPTQPDILRIEKMMLDELNHEQ